MAKAEEINESQLSDDVFELDFDEESVEYYIVDEDDNEIGVCLNENGQLVEYLYEDDPEPEPEPAPQIQDHSANRAVKKQVDDAAQSIKNMRDELGNASEDAKAVAQELKDTAEELQGMLNEVKDSFKIFPSKKKK